MPAAVNTFFEERLERLFDLAALVELVFSRAGVEYRVVGGLAVYLHVEESQPDAGRLTRDIDIVVRRADLAAIARVAPEFGLEYRHVAGVDMLVQTVEPSARRAVHIIFSGEKVRAASGMLRGVRVTGVEELIRMKLSSFRLKDQMHLKDLDEAGLITGEMESSLGEVHRSRLALIRGYEDGG